MTMMITELKEFVKEHKDKLVGKYCVISGTQSSDDLAKIDNTVALGMLTNLEYTPGEKAGILFEVLDRIKDDTVVINSADFEFGVNVASLEVTGKMWDILHIDAKEVELVSEELVKRQREYVLHGLPNMEESKVVKNSAQFEFLLNKHTKGHWISLTFEDWGGNMNESVLHKVAHSFLTIPGDIEMTYRIHGYVPGGMVLDNLKIRYEHSFTVISLTDGSCAGYNGETGEFWEQGMSNV